MRGINKCWASLLIGFVSMNAVGIGIFLFGFDTEEHKRLRGKVYSVNGVSNAELSSATKEFLEERGDTLSSSIDSYKLIPFELYSWNRVNFRGEGIDAVFSNEYSRFIEQRFGKEAELLRH